MKAGIPKRKQQINKRVKEIYSDACVILTGGEVGRVVGREGGGGKTKRSSLKRSLRPWHLFGVWPTPFIVRRAFWQQGEAKAASQLETKKGYLETWDYPFCPVILSHQVQTLERAIAESVWIYHSRVLRAVAHACPITMSLTHDAECFESRAVLFLLHNFLFSSFWYKLSLVSSCHIFMEL